MRRVFLFVLLVGVVVLALGLLALGAFPPAPHTTPVQHAIAIDKLGPHQN